MVHIIVVGAGLAGQSAALTAARQGGQVTLIYPGESMVLSAGSSQLAQGGVAAAIGADDSPSAHAEDTVKAGAGMVDPQAARYLTEAGRQAINQLLDQGLPVDRQVDGSVDFALEAAHSLPRVVHAGGDRTGAVMHQFLAQQVEANPRIQQVPGQKLHRLLTKEGAVCGLVTVDATAPAGEGEEFTYQADAVILATGGYCGVYGRSTGARQATGQGALAAAQAGALLADMEFVQFHPTVLAGTGCLISEAVRGAGAVLVDAQGQRFLSAIDPRGELAPRHVVAQGVHRALEETGQVWLDARGISGLTQEFPGITAKLRSQGIDWENQLVPVAPAAHYCMGGIYTHQAGRTTVPGLYAVGEVARTGVHGANRLASNSLLEAIVYGQAAGADAVRAESTTQASWFPAAKGTQGAGSPTLEVDVSAAQLFDGIGAVCATEPNPDIDAAVRAALDRGLGIERSATSITATYQELQKLPGALSALGQIIAAAALAREESRGAHRRQDFPLTDPAQAAPRLIRVTF
ncbi:MAG: FAD-dependent oxidoreductase [Rothia sp. (in: high G+C Gram-positive bacteria)]|nr:FAD-dependent oxidoreductase [Rothia sp. (in: high G+C Gram-positive bacteria)]